MLTSQSPDTVGYALAAGQVVARAAYSCDVLHKFEFTSNVTERFLADLTGFTATELIFIVAGRSYSKLCLAPHHINSAVDGSSSNRLLAIQLPTSFMHASSLTAAVTESE